MTEPSLVRAAADLARQAHAGQVRKAGGFVLRAPRRRRRDPGRARAERRDDARRRVLARSDRGYRTPYESRLRSEMPREVVETVEMLSEVKLDQDGKERDKRARFEGYLANLRSGSAAARARPNGRGTITYCFILFIFCENKLKKGIFLMKSKDVCSLKAYFIIKICM